MMLSPNFRLSEFTKSQTALRRGIANQPDRHQLANMRRLCLNLLEPVRLIVGGPMVITSGLRVDELNDAIGGAEDSQHKKGEAADTERPGLTNFEYAQAIEQSGLPFDQLILEFYDPSDPNAGWVHVSLREGVNRRDVLTASRRPRRLGGGIAYTTGLRR